MTTQRISSAQGEGTEEIHERGNRRAEEARHEMSGVLLAEADHRRYLFCKSRLPPERYPCQTVSVLNVN
ncbi:hypothetical protein RRSWK_01316 [Rhodopirellula sp. SWK7]|nr:hypothetical protein RRSWK_01316 [Rhodopirellula sp. SWK7]